MKKSEIVENIITVLNWGQKNKEYKNKIIDALDGVNWYLSNELMTRVLMRLSKARLTKIQHLSLIHIFACFHILSVLYL